MARQGWHTTDRHSPVHQTVIAGTGVLANVAGAVLVKTMGIRIFTTVAVMSNMLFWAGMCSGSQSIALGTAVVGILGPARTLGVSTQLSAEADRVGLSQGQLSGDRANLIGENRPKIKI